MGCEGQIIKKGSNEDKSETPEATVQLRECELALPPRARATGLAVTTFSPRHLALIRMREEREGRGGVSGAVDDDGY